MSWTTAMASVRFARTGDWQFVAAFDRSHLASNANGALSSIVKHGEQGVARPHPEPTHCVVIEDVGYLSFTNDPLDPHPRNMLNVCDLVVAPLQRRKGMGRQLVQFVEDLAGGWGSPGLYLMAEPEAVDFWVCCGYRVAGAVMGRCVPMTKVLRPTMPPMPTEMLSMTKSTISGAVTLIRESEPMDWEWIRQFERVRDDVDAMVRITLGSARVFCIVAVTNDRPSAFAVGDVMSGEVWYFGTRPGGVSDGFGWDVATEKLEAYMCRQSQTAVPHECVVCSSESIATVSRLKRGMCARFVGLEGSAELNGQECRLVRKLHDVGRWQVLVLTTGAHVRVKEGNLRAD
jgi:GNAT superfamily N-acetyltransferase